MIRAIVINGAHGGTVLNLPDEFGPRPTLTLPQVKSRTSAFADWDHADLGALFTAYMATTDYHLTFVSRDGSMLLYTTDGNPERLIDGRDWVVPSERHLFRRAPLYIDGIEPMI